MYVSFWSASLLGYYYLIFHNKYYYQPISINTVG